MLTVMAVPVATLCTREILQMATIGHGVTVERIEVAKNRCLSRCVLVTF